MKKRSTFVLLVGFFILIFTLTPQAVGLPVEIQDGSYVHWTVNVAPRNITNMYYSEGGNMLAENLSLMSCYVDSVADDIIGTYAIGNISVIANDTEIAKDLVLGVWGSPTEWWPGLFVKTGQNNIESLNVTAYAAAERVSGNYLNGSMTSRYENISVVVWNSTAEVYDHVDEECIVFDYEQDPTIFGEPQITHLAYSLNSGILVKANTSYSFGSPYNLVISLVVLKPTVATDLTAGSEVLVFSGLIGGAILAVIVIAYIQHSRRNWSTLRCSYGIPQIS